LLWRILDNHRALLEFPKILRVKGFQLGGFNGVITPKRQSSIRLIRVVTLA